MFGVKRFPGNSLAYRFFPPPSSSFALWRTLPLCMVQALTVTYQNIWVSPHLSTSLPCFPTQGRAGGWWWGWRKRVNQTWVRLVADRVNPLNLHWHGPWLSYRGLGDGACHRLQADTDNPPHSLCMTHVASRHKTGQQIRFLMLWESNKFMSAPQGCNQCEVCVCYVCMNEHGEREANVCVCDHHNLLCPVSGWGQLW